MLLSRQRIDVPGHVQAVALDPPSLLRTQQVMGVEPAHIVDRIARLPALQEMARLHEHHALGLVAADLDLRIGQDVLSHRELGNPALHHIFIRYVG